MLSRYVILASAFLLSACAREQQQPARPSPEASAGTQGGQPSASRTDDSAAAVQSRTVPPDRRDTLTGTLYISGNVPFTRLTLSVDDKRSIRLQADSVLEKELWQLQGKRVLVAGRIVGGPMGNEMKGEEYRVVASQGSNQH